MTTLNTGNSTTQEPLEERFRRLPPFQAVFEAGGPPNSSALQLYLASLDNNLEENSRQLDSCLQGLLRFTNDLPGERTFSSPKDGLLHMYSSHVLEKDSCYDPDIDEAIVILDALLKQLQQGPGTEEDVLQEILTLASNEGLLLPLRTTGFDLPDHTLVSTASLHAIADSTDQMIEQRWNKLSSKLKNYLTEQLSLLPAAQSAERTTNYCLDRRMELVESLRVLCSDETVWLTYKAIRTQQLQDVFAKLMPEVEEEGVSYKDFATNCGTVAQWTMALMNEDFVILNSGVFRKVTGVFKALHELYLEKFSDEMSLLLDEIGDEVANHRQSGASQSTSQHQGLNNNNLSGSSSKSAHPLHRNSVGGLMMRKEGSAMAARAQAQSLDSMFTISISPPTSATSPDKPSPSQSPKRAAAFPEGCLQALVKIVTALMRLEDHVESLLRSVSWDVSGLPPKKSRRKPSIRGVLKPTASPEVSRYTSHSLQYQHSGSFSSSDTQFDALVNNPHADITAAPKVVEHSRMEERFRWDWKLMFKKLSSDLTQAVETVLLDQVQHSLAAETELWDKEHVIKVVPVDAALQGGRVEYPRVTSLGSQEFVEVANQLLPVARVGCDGCLTPVRATFIDTLCVCAKNFHLQIVKMSKDVTSKATLKQLYVLLATSAMIRNHLTHYQTVLNADEGGKKTLSGAVRQFSELLDGLMKQTVQLHSQTVATTVLMDPESTDWTNFKDFYEDERCSFTVQMWNYHLRGLRYDLWSTCPAGLAQSIFSSVLQDSLLTLMQRYVRVQPSFRRVKQFRYDVTAILLCTLDHLLWACNSASKLLDPGHGQLPHYSIHNLGSNLLAALAVVASPIDAVYRVYGRGIAAHREELRREEGTSHSGNTQWMHFIWPALFPLGHKHYDDMQTTSALYLQLTLLLRQPQPHWGLLVQGLLMKEYTLSTILLTRSLILASSHHSRSESLESPIRDDTGHRSRSPEPTCGARGAVFAMIGVLAHAHQFPNALAKCVLTSVERCDDWELFNVKTTSADLKLPVWMDALFSILDPLLDKMLEPMLQYVLKKKSGETTRDSVSSKLQDLPCGCHSNAAQLAATWPAHHPVPAKDFVRRCLELLIEGVQQNVTGISSPVGVLFHSLQSACSQRNIKTPHACVGLQMLAWGVWGKLKSVEGVQRTVGLPLHPHHHHHLSMLADFFFQIIVFGKAKGGSTPRLASKFHKTHKEWLPLKVDAIVKHLSHDMFSEPETDILEGATSVFADQVAMEVAANVMATTSGAHDLRLIYDLISTNRDWLFQQLDIPLPLPLPKSSGSPPETKTLKFCVDLKPPEQDVFVPTVEQNRIGVCEFDHDTISNFQLDWGSMLKSDLGLSEFTFLNLLRNRHDMQPDAVLDDTEKKPVQALRAAFNL